MGKYLFIRMKAMASTFAWPKIEINKLQQKSCRDFVSR